MTLLVIVVAATLLVSGMCSLFEATLYSTRLATVEAANAEGRRGADVFLAMKKDVARPTSAILILNTIANTAGATIAGMLAARELSSSYVPLFSVFLTLGILFLSEILPKTYGAVHWRGLWNVIVWPLAAIQKFLGPFVWVTHKFSGLFVSDEAPTITTDKEILAMIRHGAQSGQVTPTELELLTAVFEFDELVCRQVMVPRREAVFLDKNWALGECIEIARKHQHTRYPLCDGSFEDTLGLVHIKDLIGVDLDSDEEIVQFARPIRSVPETMPIPRLLREMQRTHHHMAMVVDEYGTAVGVVTLENVLEQIVGAVQDEFDNEGPEIVSEIAGQYVIRGLTPIMRLNRLLDVTLEAPPDIDTLSGLLVSKMGRLPTPGDEVELDSATAYILEVLGNRATKIRLIVHKQETDDD